jgi:hypothetical protein
LQAQPQAQQSMMYTAPDVTSQQAAFYAAAGYSAGQMAGLSDFALQQQLLAAAAAGGGGGGGGGAGATAYDWTAAAAAYGQSFPAKEADAAGGGVAGESGQYAAGMGYFDYFAYTEAIKQHQQQQQQQQQGQQVAASAMQQQQAQPGAGGGGYVDAYGQYVSPEMIALYQQQQQQSFAGAAAQMPFYPAPQLYTAKYAAQAAAAAAGGSMLQQQYSVSAPATPLPAAAATAGGGGGAATGWYAAPLISPRLQLHKGFGSSGHGAGQLLGNMSSAFAF